MRAPPSHEQRTYPAVVAVFVLGALVSLLVAVGLYLWERERTQSALERTAARVTATAQECLDRQVTNGQLVALLFSVLPHEIGSKQFERIAGFLPANCKATQALGWVAHVPAATRPATEARLQAAGADGIVEYGADGKLVPAGERDQYFPLMYIAPRSGWRPRGYDLGSEPRHRAALLRAIENGNAGFTPESTAHLERPVLQELYFPVYEAGQSTATLAERQQHLRGLVVGVAQLHGVIETALERSGSPKLGVSLLHRTPDERWRPVYRHGNSAAGSERPGRLKAEVSARALEFGKEQFLLEFVPARGAYSLLPGWLSIGAFFGGLVTSVLAGLYVQTHKDRSESEARHLQALEAEVNERRLAEERFRIALKASAVSVFNQDTSLRYTWVRNLWDERSLLGGTDYDIADDPEDVEHLVALKRRVLSSGRGMREQVKLHIHGSDRFFNVALEPQLDPDGRVVGIIGAVVDVSEHLQLQARLRQQARQLAEADRRKDEFLSVLAHELRNPLAPISNAVQVLKRERPLTPETTAWAEGVIERQTEQLAHLVDDLLDVARITRGQITLTRRPLDLGEVITRTVECARPQMEARGHELSVGFPVEPLWVEGDRTRLIQVLGNVLDNAAKYTPPHGRVEVLASHMGGDIVIAVRDTGIGIPPERLPYVFDMFTQVRQPGGHAPEGLGLGLSISRSLVEMHGGRMEVVSPGPGKGAEFRIFLPMLTVAGPETPAPAPKPETTPALHALVVEDNSDVAKSFALLLSVLGHRVQVAHDGNAALELAREMPLDVAFLDIRMPGMDGYELAKRLRARYGENLFLVAVTGYGQTSDRERAFQAGFDEHLLKPVDPQALEAVLRTVAAGKVTG